VKVLGISEAIAYERAGAIAVRISNSVPRGEAYAIDLAGDGTVDVIACEALTAWRLTHRGRQPMLSSCSAGIRALQLDRRRRRECRLCRSDDPCACGPDRCLCDCGLCMAE
jgi:hypothetical protein